MVQLYPDNKYILSSRPFSDFRSYTVFSTCELEPFTERQALEFVDRVRLKPDEPLRRKLFKKELEENLFQTHREYATNPLLLTIMLTTYSNIGKVPKIRSDFYKSAFETLSEKHDAMKVGYSRIYKTGMIPSEFVKVFEEFGAMTYVDEKYSMTEEEFDKYFNQLNSINFMDDEVYADDFLYDAVISLCIMYRDNRKISFIHRSFQEYFSALFMSKSSDETFYKLIDFFNERYENSSDYTFEILNELVPIKVERLMILPYLRDLFPKVDLVSCNKRFDYESFWYFVKKVHPFLYFSCGEVRNKYDNASPVFLYNYILKKNSIEFKYIELPFNYDYTVDFGDEQYYSYEGKGPLSSGELAGIDFYMNDIENYKCGANCYTKIENILNSDTGIKEELENERSVLRHEYRDVLQVYRELKHKHNKRESSRFEKLFGV